MDPGEGYVGGLAHVARITPRRDGDSSPTSNIRQLAANRFEIDLTWHYRPLPPGKCEVAGGMAPSGLRPLIHSILGYGIPSLRNGPGFNGDRGVRWGSSRVSGRKRRCQSFPPCDFAGRSALASPWCSRFPPSAWASPISALVVFRTVSPPTGRACRNPISLRISTVN